jgi:hypothetical protein
MQATFVPFLASMNHDTCESSSTRGWEVQDGQLYESGEAVPVRPCVVRAVLRSVGLDDRRRGPILAGLVKRILRIERILSIRQLTQALNARA